MIYGITYTSGNMNKAATLCRDSMLNNGVEGVSVAGPGWWTCSDSFNLLNNQTLKSERGAGYWLWKPWIIAMRMNDMKDGDIFIYSDAGVEFTGPVQPIIEAMDQDIFLFSNGWKHVHWCKGDVYKNINWQENTDYESEQDYQQLEQVQASVIFFKVNQNTRSFVKEWLLWCQMPGFIDDSVLMNFFGMPSLNHPEFQEHRHDQAILTCLQIKYGYKLHYWPEKHWDNQRHRWPNDTYPIMFYQHRKRDNEW